MFPLLREVRGFGSKGRREWKKEAPRTSNKKFPKFTWEKGGTGKGCVRYKGKWKCMVTWSPREVKACGNEYVR
jgi:hypothetical protein